MSETVKKAQIVASTAPTTEHEGYCIVLLNNDTIILFGGRDWQNTQYKYHLPTKKMQICKNEHPVFLLHSTHVIACDAKYLNLQSTSNAGMLVWFGYDEQYFDTMYHVSCNVGATSFDVQTIVPQGAIVPPARCGAAYFAKMEANDDLTVSMFGGYSHTATFLNTMHKFSCATQMWQPVAMNKVPQPARSAMAFAYHEGRNSLFIHGGTIGNQQDLADLYELSFKTMTWFKHDKFDSKDTACSAHSMCIVNDKLYILVNYMIVEYDPSYMETKHIVLDGFELGMCNGGSMVFHEASQKLYLHRVDSLVQIDMAEECDE